MPDGSGGIRKKARLGKLRRRRSSVGLMALEPRLMYDGAGAATAAAAAHHHHHDHDGSSSSGSGQAASPHADAGSSTWQNNSPSATNAWRHDHEHVAPAVTTGMPSASFAGGGSAVTLDSGLTLSGGDRNGNLASATVSISGGFASGDTLSFANQNGITGSYDSATGVLTLTGTSSVANYQTALESITYSSTAVDPSNGGTDASRTISWGTSDGSHRNGTSGTATSTVAVYAPPQLGAGASTTYTSGDAAVTLDAGLTLSDPASATLSSATVAIASGFLAGDALSFTSQNGITGSYNSATGVLTLTGTSSVANYQAALASVTFKSLASDATSGGTNIDRTIAWTINDGANLASAASTVAVAAALLPGGSSGQQIVFIDGNVPDAQALAQGVQPGITVVILDPNANGVQEMADYLTENNVQNLAAIQIVSHGEDATVRLGNTIFGLADIGMFSQQLATIGSALQPGGDILFYGCNVGAGTEGLLFEVELSLATGGAHIAAASHDVGAAALGGSWTLDVTDAGIDVGNPFTATTLANYQGLLTNKIWFSQSTNSGGTSDGVFNATYLGSNPSATVSPSSVENQQQYTTFGIDYTGVQGIAVDPASGFYYAATNSALGGLVVRGSISGGTPTIIYQNTNDDTVYGVAYNSATNTVYFAQEDANAVNFPTASTTDSGIYAITSASTLTAQSGTSAATKVITTDATIPNYIAVDSTDNLIFWTNNAASASFSNDPSTLNVAPLNSSTSIGTITTLKTYTDSADNVFAGGIALDTVNHKIYWTTYNFGGSGSTGSYNDVYAASYNSAT
ncbi:MAG TPA: DUF4347 domain-containing protein, partial [Reyranella sp.]|nr:DUF4347 domain-containing protein [Reyranella sp.]